MRQARFANTIGGGEAGVQAGVAQALSFDVSAKESAQDETLAEQRVAQLHHIPILLGAMHVLCAVALFITSSISADAGVARAVAGPLILALALDVVCAGVIHFRQQLRLSPHGVTRLVCAYVALVSALWAWFSHSGANNAGLEASGLGR